MGQDCHLFPRFLVSSSMAGYESGSEITDAMLFIPQSVPVVLCDVTWLCVSLRH